MSNGRNEVDPFSETPMELESCEGTTRERCTSVFSLSKFAEFLSRAYRQRDSGVALFTAILCQLHQVVIIPSLFFRRLKCLWNVSARISLRNDTRYRSVGRSNVCLMHRATFPRDSVDFYCDLSLFFCICFDKFKYEAFSSIQILYERV